MRHAKLFRFLVWAGPTVVVVIWAIPIGIAQIGQTWPKVADWAEGVFSTWWPFVTAPLFLIIMLLLAFGYIAALVFAGSAPERLDERELSQHQRRVEIIARLRAHVVTNARHDGKHLKRFLEGHSYYPAVRKHLSADFTEKLARSDNTIYAIGDNSVLDPLEIAFLDELDKIEAKWGLD